ncbi:MAG TPA: saccharopine dehydrogenase NADP-binding domain-containing protein [Gammaproteobacteria bacterium]|nr:saccharopine dehydrogenase NADP-binding domain-containing protein [Xanthomonadales bacterium]MCB1593832.1 saccharopine dehydrogenase NADP-binding domain-containing protein [Xanthomonadales bacterium]HOP21531.1 saccharopine dehydrogenase NADP-binding domain-containing protein [Gammaproteobacteria bacterium]HPI95019.1 saccharopine dehydrogenase NADP-binding domain-containing protein [Gammaproteobacteria bacterium]HPQ86285.1 saccharopine dehydrogenase NADP-binding domain-containing protein [Gam
MNNNWMIYGANGYSGELIARKAIENGLQPTIAGRNEQAIMALAKQLNLSFKVFDLDDVDKISENLSDMDLVLHCAGPFSQTSAPMIQACLKSKTHYLDITGEVSVFEHAKSLDNKANKNGIVVCPGVGFDVIPTDCLASQLKELMPDATHLTLGFDSRSGLSAGTAKTSVEGLGNGGKVRKDGKLQKVPLAFKTRKIDFGNGEKLAMTIPWGDISTAYTSTGIPNIEVYIPSSPKLVKTLRRLNWIRFLLKTKFVQNILKKKAGKVKGPSNEQRELLKTYLWGEVQNAKGEIKQLRMVTDNGYKLTVNGSLKMVEYTLNSNKSGYFTPSQLAHNRVIEEVSESNS